VRVELYAAGVNGNGPVRQEMQQVRADVYRAAVHAARPATDYTARLIPRYDGVAIPLEEARIVWQR
jgi:starch phosphorylase